MEIKSFKIDKKDVYRSLLTDTLNNDSPISYSNDGFYMELSRLETNDIEGRIPIVTTIIEKLMKSKSWSVPYFYDIYKNQERRRNLQLVHPKDQINFSKFMSDHSSLILEWTSKSKSSIRRPSALSDTYYLLPDDFSNKYKGEDVDLDSNQHRRKYASKFFIYSGFNRLYKFYSSKIFIDNEKKYPIFLSLDISNCFQNIYTHSISWATNGKEYSKSMLSNREFKSFSDELDEIFRNGNNGETNGILVGSEVSRIFSEIILQDIDRLLVLGIKEELDLIYDLDYVFYRYVDDYAFFLKKDEYIDKIKAIINDTLSKYNLFINDSKTSLYRRPFFTNKDKLISDIEYVNKDVFSKILVKPKGKKNITYPLLIKNINRLEVYYIKSIKNACFSSGLGYSDVSGYVSSKLLRNAIEVIDDQEGALSDEDKKAYHVFFTFIINLSFFFYSVNPTTQSSFRISKLIFKLEEFYCKNLKRYYRTMISLVWGKIKELLLASEGVKFDIENLNILISCRKFDWYLRQDPIFKDIVNKKIQSMDYFSIVNMLSILGYDDKYKAEKRKISELALDKIWSNKLDKCSETCHLFFDLVSCPYVDDDIKEKALKHQCDVLLGGGRSDVQIKDEVKGLLKTSWFIDWRDLSIERSLQRKELNSIY